MTLADRKLDVEEQAAIAVANLTTAVSVALAGAGLFGPVATMLDTFESLNQVALPPGNMADLLQMTVDTHRSELAAAMAEAERGRLDS